MEPKRGSPLNPPPAKDFLAEEERVLGADARSRNYRPQVALPKHVKKRRRRLAGFNDTILSPYAHGMTVREIQGHLSEMHGTEVSPDLISQATAALAEVVNAWRTRPLERVYATVEFAARTMTVSSMPELRPYGSRAMTEDDGLLRVLSRDRDALASSRHDHSIGPSGRPGVDDGPTGA